MRAALQLVGENIDDTGPRIRAFIRSMRLLDGCTLSSEELDSYARGLVALELLAETSKGCLSPKRKLTVEECADIAHFISWVTPKAPKGWWDDPDNAPSRACGLMFIMQAVRDSLRAVAQ